MQIGDIIKGARGEAYLVIQALGAPGLFGQAFLCRRTDDSSEAVVKTLRAGRPHEDRERFLQEAATLERMAEFEGRAGKHYAVRLLDHSAPDVAETFLVLERATGQNVLDDLIRPIADWRHAPLDELLALDIARQLAQALRIAHQAGICYDDMKLDNLFWNAQQPDDPLRIVDWNVTSSVAERGVAGDWARFGARLYELCTGERIGITRDGTLLGDGPAGARWQQLPEGLRDIISQALSLRYADDAPVLRDLRRESEQARMGWPELLERATIADGEGQTIDVLAPTARAERLLLALPADDPGRESALARCAELRQRAALRRGVASARALDYAIQSLARNEPKLAVERLQKAYAETGSRDPRPRRWLWVARFAAEQGQRYRAVRNDLEGAVQALNHDDPASARAHLTAVSQADPDLPIADWLLAEAESQLAASNGAGANGIFKHEQLRAVLDQYPDLRAMRDELQQRHADHERRRAALMRESELWDNARRERDEADRAEQRGEEDLALRSSARALVMLDQILADGCTPEIEDAARTLQRQLSQQRERLERQAIVRQLPERANSPDPRQRIEALRLAEELVPDWVELPRLREHIRQIDESLTTLERAQGSDPGAGSEQALAALDALEQFGVKLDRAGADLRVMRKRLTDRRAAQRNNQARARAKEAAQAIEQARAQLSQAKCEEALRELRALNTHETTAELKQEVERLLRRAADLSGQIERIDQQRAEIERHFAAANWSYACRLAQRLAQDNPQLPRLAEESLDRERNLWGAITIGARELASYYRRLSLKEGSAQLLSQLDVEAARLMAQRQAADEPIALAEAQRAALRADADDALEDLELAREEWRETRSASLAELERYLEQACAAADAGDDGTARRTLIHIRNTYLPPDAREQGLEPLVIRVERLAHELKQRRDSQIARLHDLEARLSNPAAQLWFEELSEPFKEGPALLDPEIQPAWEHVRELADQTRRQLARINWPDQLSNKERLDQIESALATLGRAAEQARQHSDRHSQQLHEAIERGEQAARRQIMAIEAEHQQTTALLESHRNILLGAFAAQFIFMLAFIVIIVRFG